MIKCSNEGCKGWAKITGGWCDDCKDKHWSGVKNKHGKTKLTIPQIQERLLEMGKKVGMFNNGKLWYDKPDNI